MKHHPSISCGGGDGDRDGGDSNALILQCKKKKNNKGNEKLKVNGAPKMSKSQIRRLKKIEEEKEKSLKLANALKTIQEYAIPEKALSLLKSTSSIGQAETRKRKRKRMVDFSKAGIEVPRSERSLERTEDDRGLARSESEEEEESCCLNHRINENPNEAKPIVLKRDLQEKTTLTSCSSRLTVDEDRPVLDYGFEDDDFRKDSNSTGLGLVRDSCKEIPMELRNLKPIVVNVSRPDEVEKARKDLPIVMMEQEIMEAINYHSAVIICGETGCGKTTQVPQFLYEAGFGSKENVSRSGIIGVTQPRRVAVLATAKRVAYELGLPLGKVVGFQVRYDKKIGHDSSIKFMTDGILLRELQNDFLLRRYSVLILDEAHERSLNTDILIGMLSRVIQAREKIYIQQQKLTLSGKVVTPESQVFPLKLVLMSATLRVEDFLSGKKLFPKPPPVMEVPTRQYPVTVHFSKRTEIVDYIGQAHKKILAIHKQLPPGGILVFVTGQREVEYLCQKLRRASKELMKKACKENAETCETDTEVKLVEGISMDEIDEAFDSRENSKEDNDEEFIVDEDELLDSYDSESDSDLEFIEDNVNSSQDNNLIDVLGGNENLESLKSAFEALAGKTESNPSSVTSEARLDQVNPSSAKSSGSQNDSSPGALRVLPLYAMLPGSAQLRVFEDINEGERLVVVATNVAETSLTIPGIKYVVDTGREKVKNYDSATGMEKFEVQWVSKASAAQRAGRAGRISPGHCYRLYSSAVFNNMFKDFSPAEILKVPVDGVVLLMKSMGISKVANFPFPTPPDASALVEAERCLKALEALDSDSKLTALGKAMARYPMSPRHSRMLLTAFQMIEKKKSNARPNLVLAYAIAAAAALSLSNPFVRQLENSQTVDDPLKNDDLVHKEEKSKKKKLQEAARASRERFSNPSSDALSIAYALQCFEMSENAEEFCEENFLHLKTMEEMAKLRKQLLRIVFSQSGSDCDFSWEFGNSDEVEQSWSVFYEKHPLTLYEEELLGQCICAGWADRVAKRVRINSKSLKDDGNARAVRYQACSVNETVFLHRWSFLSSLGPEFLVYSDLIRTKRPYMHGVTRVRSEWLVEFGHSLCTFSAPSADTKPYYEPRSDRVMNYMVPSFGPHLWELPPYGLTITDIDRRVIVFGYALLEGQVLPCLRSVREFMAAPPASILRPEASGQKRVGNLLSKLKRKSIFSCAKLREAWIENPRELFSEIKDWFQQGFGVKNFEVLWSQMLGESVLDARERFPRKVSSKNKEPKRLKINK